jgi:hypothetical protein
MGWLLAAILFLPVLTEQSPDVLVSRPLPSARPAFDLEPASFDLLGYRESSGTRR